ncbi:MAG TPA: glycosyltransferase [Thermomicrobiales bacterium]|nr:glycosyltransferase [Thermomicrobiales bacterium]
MSPIEDLRGLYQPFATDRSVQRVAMISVHTSPVAVLGGRDAGGLNVYVRELSHQLDRCGVNVDIFTRREDEHTADVVHMSDRVRVVTINAGPRWPAPKNDVYGLLPEFASEVALYSLLSGARYDIVHSHYWLSGWASHLITRYWSAPTVHTFHTLARLKNNVVGAGQQESALRLETEQRLLSVMDNIVAPNPDERAEMVWRMGAENSHICVIPPGVDLDRFHPHDSRSARQTLDLPENPIVLFVGRVDPMKGIETLIDGFAALRHQQRWTNLPPKLVFIGGSLVPTPNGPVPGPDLQPVIERARQLGVLEDIVFKGSEPQDLLPDYYAAATVCAVPSRYESFGLVAVEAMACGLPVVASRAGGLKFTVEEDISGILVPPNDPGALAEALGRIIRDPDLRASMRVGARQAAIRFSWQTIGPAMLNLYERLAEGHRENLCCLGDVYAS